MRNYWLVARHEYRRTVLRRAFVLLTLAIPIAFTALIALAVAVELASVSRLPVGYVDHAGFLEESRQQTLPDLEDRIEVRAFASEEAARAALEREEIQAFFVFPAGYPASLETQLFYWTDPLNNSAWGDFDDFVRVNLLASYPEAVQARLLEGSDITVYDIASQRTFGGNDITLVLPFIGTVFFFIATMSASGYMLQVVADEKENRTMELMLTSVTPGQLILGKGMGLLAAALTQLAIYLGTALIGLAIARQYVPSLQDVTMPWGYVGLMFLYFLPSYVLISAIMVAIGSAVTELQQAQQVAGLLNLVFMSPLFFLIFIFMNPAGLLPTLLSLFPPTAFLTISLRWGLGTVPLWQLLLSWLLLVASAGFMMWAAAKIFRVGMLRYGQPLSLTAAMQAVRRHS